MERRVPPNFLASIGDAISKFRHIDIDLSVARTNVRLSMTGLTFAFIPTEAFDNETTISSTLTVGKGVARFGGNNETPMIMSAGIVYRFPANQAIDEIYFTNAAQASKMMRVYYSAAPEVIPFVGETVISGNVTVLNPAAMSIDLTGRTYAEQVGIGTNNVVTAVANTGGIELALAHANSHNASGIAEVRAGGNKLVYSEPNTDHSSNTIKNVLIPAGDALDLVGNHAGCVSFCWHKVL